MVTKTAVMPVMRWLNTIITLFLWTRHYCKGFPSIISVNFLTLIKELLSAPHVIEKETEAEDNLLSHTTRSKRAEYVQGVCSQNPHPQLLCQTTSLYYYFHLLFSVKLMIDMFLCPCTPRAWHQSGHTQGALRVQFK